jgi:hypothetical protein
MAPHREVAPAVRADEPTACLRREPGDHLLALGVLVLFNAIAVLLTR